MSSDSQPSSTTIDLVREEFERVHEGRDLDAIDELYASDCVVHTTDHEFHGPDEYRAYVSVALDAFSDLELTIHNFIATDDEVATRHSWQATHQGELRGIPPTGEQVKVDRTCLPK